MGRVGPTHLVSAGIVRLSTSGHYISLTFRRNQVASQHLRPGHYIRHQNEPQRVGEAT